MALLESSFSTDDSDEGQAEVKRSRHEPRTYGMNRRHERPHRSRKSRLSSRDHTSHHSKDNNLEALIFDSGAYSIKVNYSFEQEPKIIPNCIMKAKSERKRLFIGNQIDECRDCSGLFYLIPCERGYITKWDVQKPIWDYVFSKNVCPVNSYPVVMTQPLFNFKSIQDCVDEIFFEEYEVSSLYRTNPTDLAARRYHQDVGSQVPCVIVDSGYSFTHVIPYIDGKKFQQGIRRINVGGKLLTNHLKDIISYRQYHVMEETYVINQVKEDTCFVSSDFKNDLKTAELPPSRNTIVRNYVLPDFNNIRRGYIQDPGEKDEIAENCQILRLNNERFTVPEILFHPSDIGLKSVGVAEAVYKSIMSCPPSYHKVLAKNVVCVGGSTEFPGFRDRLYAEVRSMLPASWEVEVYQPPNPISYTWSGGKALLKSPHFKSKLVTKEQYEELGLSAIQERFNDWSVPVEKKSRPKKCHVEPVSYIEHVKKYDVFGKGNPLENPASDGTGAAGKSDKAGQDSGAPNSRKGDEEVDVSTKKDEESSGSAPETKQIEPAKVGKATKKNVRTAGQVIYSVKILSSAPKASS